MHSSILNRVRVATISFLLAVAVLAVLTGNAWSATGYKGGVPWQVGDIIICFGTTGSFGGACNMVRIVGSSPVLLDQFSDGLLGDTTGVAIDNTLHVVVTDDGSGDSDSNVVVYTIASLNPGTSPPSMIAHTILPNTPFNASGGPGSGNAQAVVVNGAGHIFVGNAGSGGGQASIVELNPNGTPANTFSVPAGCIDGQFTSMDLSKDGNTIYFTSRGTTVQKLRLSPTPVFSCSVQQIVTATESGNTVTITTSAAHGFSVGEIVTVAGVTVLGYNGTFKVLASPAPTTTSFSYTDPTPGLADSGGGTVSGAVANFATSGPTPASPAVTLFDVAVVPAGSLSGTCNGNACPTTDALLVVAKGLTAFDNDADAEVISDPGLGIVAATETTTTATIADSPNGATESGNTVTITTSAAHGLIVGETVTVAGVGVSGYNGTFTVLASPPPTTTTFSYTDPTPGLADSGGGMASGTLATITTSAAHGFAANDVVTVAGVGVSGYNGTFTVLATPSTTTFSYSDSSSGLAPSSGGTVNGPSTGDDLLIDVCTGTTPTTTQSSCALLVDPGTGNTLARYPVAASSNLQALALDPLVSDCTGGCSAGVPAPTVSNFWVGDSQQPNFYEVNFASGNVSSAFTANPTTTATTNSACTTCSTVAGIQGLRIYGAEGANQADLTKLTTGSLAASNNFTGTAQFPLPADSTNTNTLAVTLFPVPNTTLPPATPFKLWGSLISKNSGTSDVGSVGLNNVTLAPPPPCEPSTADSTKCIVWKIDVGTLGVPNTYLGTNFTGPSTPPTPGIDFGTHVFLDEHYDVTNSLGTFDPTGGSCTGTGCKTFTSVWSLQEIPATFTTSGSGTPSGCFYINPSPAGACFKNNRTSLPFTFQCPGVSTPTFAGLQNAPGPPELGIVQSPLTFTGTKPAPQPINLAGTNTKGPYRYDATKNDYVFQWNLPTGITGSFNACTFDPTGTIQGFCTTFTIKKSCP
jgi:hypothetical protein